MLSHLTQYFFQYRRVAIPQIGRFEIQQEPAELNFVEKQINPPRYFAVLQAGYDLSPHQLQYLMQATHTDAQQVKAGLLRLSDQLHHLSARSINWAGLGWFEAGKALPLELQLLKPVPAMKVSRQNASHTILVGDKEVVSSKESSIKKKQRSKPSLVATLGWIVLAVAAGLALWLLFTGRFSIDSFGLRTAP